MEHRKVPLRKIEKDYLQTEYKDGGNFSSSYFALTENSFLQTPITQIKHSILNCTYLNTHTTIPITVKIWPRDSFKFGSDLYIVVGSYIYTGTFTPNFIKDISLYIPKEDLLATGILTITFTGFNKFSDPIEFTENLTIIYEKDCE